jgi:predicted DNA-binding transcriptional regulator YafY
LFSQYSGAVQKIINAVNIQKANVQLPYFDFVDFEKVPVIKGSEFLQTVIEAIRYKQVLKLRYQSFDRDEPVDHVVHPYLLKEYRNRWYIVGLHDEHHAMRTFGLDRILSIARVNKKYIESGFSAREYYRNVIGIISPSGVPPEIIIAVKKRQAQYLITQPLHESQEVVEEREEEIIFRLKVHPTYELISVFLGYGYELSVIEPAELREEIINVLRKALECYVRKV